MVVFSHINLVIDPLETEPCWLAVDGIYLVLVPTVHYTYTSIWYRVIRKTGIFCIIQFKLIGYELNIGSNLVNCRILPVKWHKNLLHTQLDGGRHRNLYGQKRQVYDYLMKYHWNDIFDGIESMKITPLSLLLLKYSVLLVSFWIMLCWWLGQKY